MIAMMMLIMMMKIVMIIMIIVIMTIIMVMMIMTTRMVIMIMEKGGTSSRPICFKKLEDGPVFYLREVLQLVKDIFRAAAGADYYF